MSRPVFLWIESPGTSLSLDANADTVKFGDGYQVDFGRGINPPPDMWDLVFTNADASIANDIQAFLKDGLGSKRFEWVPPGETVAKVFKCMSFSRSIGSEIGQHNLRARFEQVFEV